MRIRASVAVVTGALALTGLTVPMAQADDAKPGSWPSARSGASSFSVGGPTFSKIVVNGGKAAVIGTTAKKTVTVSFTASDPQGIYTADVALWRGKNLNTADSILFSDDFEAKCGTGTAPTCKATFTIDPALDLWDKEAGSWKVALYAMDEEANETEKAAAGTLNILRAAKLTVNAAPEPVKKNKTITITGALTRASWDSGRYVGYGSQSVKLQYLKKGAKAYSTVKTIKSDSKGNLKTTVKATADGYYRYVFAGTSSTAGSTPVADYIDVR